MLVVGIGDEVKDFLHQLGKNKGKKLIKTTWVKPDTPPLQMAPSVVSMITRTRPKSSKHESEVDPDVQVGGYNVEAVVHDAPNVQFGDSLGQPQQRKLVDAAILNATKATRCSAAFKTTIGRL